MLKGASGYYDLESKKMLTGNEAMPIASGTKQMTASCILKLQEQGKLNVHNHISRYLTKDSPYFDGKLPSWASTITIHQLLTHTSGLAEYIPALSLDFTKSHKEINKSIVAHAINNPLTSNPGTKYSYCNTGYVLLGLIIEQVSGKDLISFFNEELFKPLGMHDTKLVTLQEAVDFQSGKLKEFPTRYFIIPGGEQPQFVPVNSSNSFMLAPFSDGGVISTLQDMNKWNYALHNGKVLSDVSYKLMTTPYSAAKSYDHYDTFMGYGIFVAEPKKGDTFYMHAGSTIGIRGEYIYIPAKKLAISIISNTYVHEPEALKGKIDYTKPSNQVDIHYFMHDILEAIQP